MNTADHMWHETYYGMPAQVCRCPYTGPRAKRPWVDVTTAVCARCDRRLSVAARDRFRQAGVISMPWAGFDR